MRGVIYVFILIIISRYLESKKNQMTKLNVFQSDMAYSTLYDSLRFYVPSLIKFQHLKHYNYEENKTANNSYTLANRRHFDKKPIPILPDISYTLSKRLNDLLKSSSYNNSVENKIKIGTKFVESNKENRELHKEHVMDTFMKSLEQFERIFYKKTFDKLNSLSPPGHEENGISFIQSGLFLFMALLTISTEVLQTTRYEIENCLGYKVSSEEKVALLKQIISWLPSSSDNVKFRWASRLVINAKLPVSKQFEGITNDVHLYLHRINGSQPLDVLIRILNNMIEEDSGGAMHNTFDEDDISQGICSILLNTMYIRPRWRTAPTVLNGTRAFYDSDKAHQSSVRMIRLNDIMQYAALDEWNADAIQIMYATPGLSLLLLVPRGRSLKSLANVMSTTSLHNISKNMRNKRMAVTLPIFTLRMTLLLPEKLRMMGFSRLIETDNKNRCDGEFRLSHAVQRLMFWAEAGKNAFKDDGVEWDESPDLKLVIDRPYLFFVRWNNITLLNGNFVL